jgi:hypothetical protein
MMVAGASLALAAAAAPVAAQEFVPPDRGSHPVSQPASSSSGQSSSGFKLDILGFSTRAGFQVNNGGQALLGSTVDLVQLGIPQVRARSSFEVGFGRPSTSIGVNEEIMYRFLADTAAAIPYIGLGVGYMDDNVVKRVWPTVAIGFELPFRRSMNWLVEYHALDALRRSRFFIGLATRGGS